MRCVPVRHVGVVRRHASKGVASSNWTLRLCTYASTCMGAASVQHTDSNTHTSVHAGRVTSCKPVRKYWRCVNVPVTQAAACQRHEIRVEVKGRCVAQEHNVLLHKSKRGASSLRRETCAVTSRVTQNTQDASRVASLSSRVNPTEEIAHSKF